MFFPRTATTTGLRPWDDNIRVNCTIHRSILKLARGWICILWAIFFPIGSWSARGDWTDVQYLGDQHLYHDGKARLVRQWRKTDVYAQVSQRRWNPLADTIECFRVKDLVTTRSSIIQSTVCRVKTMRVCVFSIRNLKEWAALARKSRWVTTVVTRGSPSQQLCHGSAFVV